MDMNGGFLVTKIKQLGDRIFEKILSEKNHDATVGFFKEHDYFGYDKDYIAFFKQDMAPAADFDGKVYMEAKDSIATSPNGNGGWFLSMKKSGLLELVDSRSISVKCRNSFWLYRHNFRIWILLKQILGNPL